MAGEARNGWRDSASFDLLSSLAVERIIFGVATRLHIEVAEPVVMALRQVDWRSNSVIYAAW